MTLENTFYVLGIITMSLSLLLLIVIVVLLFYIKKKITDVTKNIEDKLRLVKDIATHPKETAVAVGEAVADVALSRAGKMIAANKKKA